MDRRISCVCLAMGLFGCGASGNTSSALPTQAEPLAAHDGREPGPGTKKNDEAVIDLVVTGFRNDEGHALVALFASEEGFPNRGDLAVRSESLAIRDQKVTVSFADLAPGNYAIAILHDEDDDLEMSTNIVGIPKEGYGVSQNARGRLGPPSFDEAKVTVAAGQTVPLRIRIAYP